MNCIYANCHPSMVNVEQHLKKVKNIFDTTRQHKRMDYQFCQRYHINIIQVKWALYLKLSCETSFLYLLHDKIIKL
jgi:hypothetical protein